MQTTPLIKISISDIVGECGMNRNSFYYHFKDKYELLNWIFLTEITVEVTQEEVFELSIWELISRISRYLYDNKAFYANAMNYEGQDSFNDFFREFLETLFETRSEDIFEENNKNEEFQEFYINFFVDLTISTLSRWIKEDAKYPPDRFVKMVKKATVSAAIKILQDA